MDAEKSLEKLLNADRRVLFLLVFAAAAAAMLIDIPLPIKPSAPVIKMYEEIEKLAAKEGSAMLISMDYDPGSKPELEPMSRAIIRHALRRGIRVVGMTHNPSGQDLGERVLFDVAGSLGKEYGKDFVYLGFKPGGAALVINLAQDFQDAFGSDFKGASCKSLEATARVKSLSDFGFVVSITASAFWETWVVYGQSKYGFDMGVGVAGVIAPDVFPFLQTGQIKGLLGGLAGAAEYETITGKPGAAAAGMRPQSAVHLLIIVLVLAGNAFYFALRCLAKKRAGGR